MLFRMCSFLRETSGKLEADSQPDPLRGEGYYYLVRTQSECDGGTFGSASSGAQRLLDDPCDTDSSLLILGEVAQPPRRSLVPK